jgi:predicted lipoprotein with Yx(FWY)xxD motif
MKYQILIGAVVMLALLLAACAPANPTEAPAQPTATEPQITETTEPTEPSATETTAAATTEPAATETTTTGETPTLSVPITGEGTVMVSESADYGSILTNNEGMSLYVFMADTQNGGASTCNADDGCSTEWPPLVSEGQPVAGEGVDAAMLGTITREDGTMQVTYNGWPLYLFEEDGAPGDVNGQGLEEFGGLWYLVSPTGEAIQ